VVPETRIRGDQILIDLALVLLLAQTCAAEIDLQPKPDECFEMFGINSYNAARKRITVAQQTRRFNAYWKVEHTTKAWIGALSLDSTKAPAGFPARRGAWAGSKWSKRWARYVVAATRFVERNRGTAVMCTDVKSGAELAATDYGGTPGDGVYADDDAPCPEARRLSCIEGEKQAYWATRGCSRARRARVRSGSITAAAAGAR
jgi:hypothetical protein